MARGAGFPLRSHRNASGIHDHYPDVPQKGKPGAHLNPKAQSRAMLLGHAVSNFSFSALHRTRSSKLEQQRTPEETQNFLDFHTHLTKTWLCAWVLVQAANSATVTEDAIRETPVAKLAAVTFVPSVTFPAWTLTWPFPWGRKKKQY